MDGGNLTMSMSNAKGMVSSCSHFFISFQVKLIIFSVNELAAKLQALENSLINNNLLQSCTIRGVTNDWYQGDSWDGVVAVKGIQFKMELFFIFFLLKLISS